MIKRWLGKEFEMRKVRLEDPDRVVGGEHARVIDVRMAGDLKHPLVNLTLRSPVGILFLTTEELEKNVV